MGARPALAMLRFANFARLASRYSMVNASHAPQDALIACLAPVNAAFKVTI